MSGLPQNDSEPVVVRSGANHGAGVCLALGALVFIVLADPHGLVLDGFDAEGATPRELLLLTVGMAALSIGGYALFARPDLEIWPGDRVVIRNPLQEVTVPVERLDQVDEAGKYLRLRSGRRWYTAWGTEQMSYRLALGRGNLAAGLLSVSSNMSVEATDTDKRRPVKTTWRRVTPLEALLLAAWVPHLAKGGLDAFL